jgi:hypothetical protein
MPQPAQTTIHRLITSRMRGSNLLDTTGADARENLTPQRIARSGHTPAYRALLAFLPARRTPHESVAFRPLVGGYSRNPRHVGVELRVPAERGCDRPVLTLASLPIGPSRVTPPEDMC